MTKVIFKALSFVYINTPFELARDCLIYAGLNILEVKIFYFPTSESLSIYQFMHFFIIDGLTDI